MIRNLSASIVLLLVVLAPSPAAQCVDWTAGFHRAGIVGDVNASAVFDDGSGNGSELYLGGAFESAGDVAVQNIVKWNGTRWAPVGGGRPLPVTALLVWNDGSGPVLVAACGGSTPTLVGDSQGNLAKWNGVAWTGFQGTAALASAGSLAVHDDGSGPALYVGASFSNINGPLSTTQVIARFAGNQWSAVGSGLFTVLWAPRAMLAHDDGSGTRLFVAGTQLSTTASGAQSPVWTWDGNTWTSASGGWSAAGDAHALCVVHSGTGVGTLYAGGYHTLPAGPSKLMRWNGTGWDGVGPSIGSMITALIERTEPGMPARLAAGGDPYTFDQLGTGSYAEWDGGQWTVPVPLIENILTFAHYDEGTGPKLFAGLRRYATPGPYPSHGVSRLDATQWVTPGTSGLGEEGVPTGLAAAPGPSGPALYACGFLEANTGVRANRVQRFDGNTWTPVGPTFNHGFTALHAFDDGIHGEQLYACGAFIDAGGVGMNRVARWDGSAWQPLGGGVGGVGYEAVAYGMITWDDGVMKRLVVFGDFNLAVGVLSPYLAAWDGTHWSSFGSGLDGVTLGAAVYDDGTGSALYVSGQFTHAGGVPVAHLARWNGSTWSAVGAGPGGFSVGTLAVFDDGSGPKLYAAVGRGTTSIERWDGVSWQTVPSGPLYSVLAMKAYDDGTGTGPRLCLTSNVESGSIACFDGTGWTTPGSGIGGGVPRAFAVFDDGHGPALWAAGEFSRAGNFGSQNVARFGPTGTCVAHTGTAFCFGDGSGAACPCGNAGAAGRGCGNSMNAQGAVLVAEGQAHLTSDNVTLRATDLTPNAILLYFQGTGQVAGGLGAPFGDGLRCVNGSVVRMAVRHATAGVSAFGHAVGGDPSLSAAGHLSGSWSTRSYQAWYRDVQSFCTSAPYNLTNAITIRWAP